MGSEPSALIGRIPGDGPLFRSRYKAILIDAEKYFLSVGRYLHQNSIRAALVTNMDRYRCSSSGLSCGRKWTPSQSSFHRVFFVVQFLLFQERPIY